MRDGRHNGTYTTFKGSETGNQGWFADLPRHTPIDLSRGCSGTLGAVKPAIGAHLARQGFHTAITRLGGVFLISGNVLRCPRFSPSQRIGFRIRIRRILNRSAHKNHLRIAFYTQCIFIFSQVSWQLRQVRRGAGETPPHATCAASPHIPPPGYRVCNGNKATPCRLRRIQDPK